jgi:hypothetical protein
VDTTNAAPAIDHHSAAERINVNQPTLTSDCDSQTNSTSLKQMLAIRIDPR